MEAKVTGNSAVFSMSEYAPAVEAIKRGKRFVVVSHVSPEPDAVGSLLGLTLALRSIGKTVVAFLEDPVPGLCEYLPGSSTIVHKLGDIEPVDYTFALDCGQLSRLGDGLVNFKGRGTVINIDHHATNDKFGDVNIINAEASAAGEMVYDLLKEAGIKVNKDAATCLYSAIHTDTGSFRYSSATPDAFRKAGELVLLGADPWDVSKNFYENHPLKRLKMLGMVLPTLDVIEDGKIASLIVTLDMLKSVDATKDIVDGFVNYARAIQGVEVGVLLRENSPGEYKVSMRSKGSVDVSSLSLKFGGGGHKHAAGFSVKGTLETAKKTVLDAVLEVVRGK